MSGRTGHEFLDDVAIADVAFRAYGPTLESVFAEAAEATLETMLDNPEALRPVEHHDVRLHETNADMLLFEFLQEFIFFKDAHRLLLRPLDLRISRASGGYDLTATLAGQSIDPLRHRLNADVKAVTMHRFRLEETDSGWEAETVLDI